jgi:hypothetical protein
MMLERLSCFGDQSDSPRAEQADSTDVVDMLESMSALEFDAGLNEPVGTRQVNGQKPR